MKFVPEMEAALQNKCSGVGIVFENDDAQNHLRTALMQLDKNGDLKNPAQERSFIEIAAINVIREKVNKTDI